MKTQKISTENLAVNFCKTPLIVSFGAWLSHARQTLSEASIPLKDCLRDAFGLFGAGERIAELTQERGELADQIDALQRENLALHVEREERQEEKADMATTIQDCARTVEYLMAEKTRLTSLNAELCARLASASPPSAASRRAAPSRLDRVAARAARSHAPHTAPESLLN